MCACSPFFSFSSQFLIADSNDVNPLIPIVIPAKHYYLCENTNTGVPYQIILVNLSDHIAKINIQHNGEMSVIDIPAKRTVYIPERAGVFLDGTSLYVVNISSSKEVAVILYLIAIEPCANDNEFNDKL